MWLPSVDWPHFLTVHSWLWLWAPENESSHIFPGLVFLPLFTHNGDVTRHPTTQPPAATAVVINLIRCLPQTADTIFKWQLFCLGFLLRVAMPGNGLVIYIVCVSSNSWKQVENELITVIKPEFAFFTITSLEKGTHLKAVIASGGTEAIHECMC